MRFLSLKARPTNSTHIGEINRLYDMYIELRSELWFLVTELHCFPISETPKITFLVGGMVAR